MLLLFFSTSPAIWLLYWAMLSTAYYFILPKMGKKIGLFIIPFLAEREMSRDLFRRMRSFYRPFIVSVILIIAALYLNPMKGAGRLYMILALIIYGGFKIRLYRRLAKSFGKKFFFTLGIIVLPFIFLMILGLGRSEYRKPELKPAKTYGKFLTVVNKALAVGVSALELMLVVVVVGAITFLINPPRAIVDWSNKDFREKSAGIVADRDVVTWEEALGDEAAQITSLGRSRELYFPDHSKDKNVVVMCYVVGSNLEGRSGLASANIDEMIEATKQGSGLTFVMEAGGSRRWFTKGIDDESYGRYEIKDGELKLIEKLPEDMCLSESVNLSDFITWTAEKYPADRYMLVLWDHGGGVAYGFGQDDQNKLKGGNETGTMRTSELLDALKTAGMRFDIIGFDACLMQDIEIAASMEPYCDYFLASEEVEGGYGWYYTYAFGKLAENPGRSSDDFAVDIISTYDQLNTILKNRDGEPDTGATLSFIDTTLAKPAYDKLSGVMAKLNAAILKNEGAYADASLAARSAYNFSDYQIDLIGFLDILGGADYEDRICPEYEIRELIAALKRCVLYRNSDSAEGINGVAVAIPVRDMTMYADTSLELGNMSLDTQRKTLNNFFSIMAVQKQKNMDSDYVPSIFDGESMDDLETSRTDFTKEEWYVKGFENYVTAEAMTDIPLEEAENGYKILLPDEAWDIVMDEKVMLFENVVDKNGNVMLRLLGSDHVGIEDENAHPMLAFDGSWVHINGILVSYEAEASYETAEGVVFTGKVRARLNGREDINLLIEWDPFLPSEPAEAPEGHIVGYELVSTDPSAAEMKTRGNHVLEAGDYVQFVYSWFDEEGHLIKTEAQGVGIYVSRQDQISVRDRSLKGCSVMFYEVLTDAYQRTMITEKIMADVE